jgi:hypothetical protein
VLAVFERSGVPEGLLATAPADADLGGRADKVVDTRPAREKGTLLALDGAPVERTVAGALWAGFAGAGGHRAAVGRLVTAPSVAEPLIAALVEGARQLRPGDPRLPETEVGPLRSAQTRERVAALVDAAVADGATLLCGGPLDVPGVDGAFYAPAVLRGVAPGARILHEPVPGPVLAVVETSSEEDAIALARGSRAVSVWAGDRAHGERVARSLEAEVAWVNEHGHAIPSAAVRVTELVEPRRLASQPTQLRSARWLPYDPALVRAATSSARVMYGREADRLRVLREGAIPLARTATRLAREALQR